MLAVLLNIRRETKQNILGRGDEKVKVACTTIKHLFIKHDTGLKTGTLNVPVVNARNA